MTITTTLLVNGVAVAVVDIMTVVDDIVQPSRMTSRTSVTVRETGDAPKVSVGVLSTKIEMTPGEMKAMNLAQDVIEDYDQM